MKATLTAKSTRGNGDDNSTIASTVTRSSTSSTITGGSVVPTIRTERISNKKTDSFDEDIVNLVAYANNVQARLRAGARIV